MMPEQQRGIDQAIIDGKLIDAIRLYRSVSGASTRRHMWKRAPRPSTRGRLRRGAPRRPRGR